MKLLFQILFVIISYQVSAQNTGSSKEHFLNLASYLSNGEGQWMTPNPQYDSKDSRSSTGFGLWFDFELEENLLRLTHVVFREDTAHITGESFWIWHPGERQIKYYSTNIRGGFTDGETLFTKEDRFVTTEYSYSVGGKIELSKDDNTIISPDEHLTTTSVFKDNSWKITGQYRFRKTKDKEYYKAIKDY